MFFRDLAGYLAIAILLNFPSCVHAADDDLAPNRFRLYYEDIQSVEFGLDGFPDIFLKVRLDYLVFGTPVALVIPKASLYEDILLCGTASGEFVQCTMMAGAALPTMPSSSFSLLTADFDGDGLIDIFLLSSDPNVNSIYLLNDGTGSFTVQDQFTSVEGVQISGSSDIWVSDEFGHWGSELRIGEDLYLEERGGEFSDVRSTHLYTSLVGASPIQFGVSQGQAEVSIPINIPAGGAGVSPKLSLSYSGGARYGIAGMGFSLSGMSSIQRCGRSYERDGYVRGVDGSQSDLLCLDGNRLTLVSGVYWGDGSVYYPENETYSKVVYSISGGEYDEGEFTVYQKNGDVIRYGSTESSRAQGRTWSTAKWAISSVSDRFSQGYVIEYEPGTGAHFPKEIRYTVDVESSAVTAPVVVEFTYEEDPYRAENAVFGAKYEAGRRLKQISSWYNNHLFRHYHFSYEISAETGRALLSSYLECGSGDECFPANTLSWGKASAPDFSHATYAQFGPATVEGMFVEGEHFPNFNRWFDVDRDGDDDYCRIAGLGTGNHVPVEVRCYVSGGNGQFSSEFVIDAGLYGVKFDPSIPESMDQYNWNMDPSWQDMNQDGFVDLCFSRPGDSTDGLECLLNGADPQTRFTQSTTASVTRSVGKLYVGGRSWTDINGDSRTDYCSSYLAGAEYQQKWLRCAIQDTGSFSFTEVFNEQLGDELGGYWVDITGDGLPDYCIMQETELDCYRNNMGQSLDATPISAQGSNFKSSEGQNYIYYGSTTKYFSAQFLDYSNDGFPDFCRIYKHTQDGNIGYRASCLLGVDGGWGADVVSEFMSVTPDDGSSDYEEMAEATAFMDVNEDGNVDWCAEIDVALRCFLTTPDGFGSQEVTYQLPDLGVNQSGLRGMREIIRGNANHEGNGRSNYCALYWKSLDPVVNKGMACFGAQSDSGRDYLVGVTNGFGVEYSVEYSDISDPSVYDYDVSQGSAGQVFATSGMRVVSRLTTSNGIGGYSHQNYFYKNFGYFLNEFGSVGFGYVRVTSEDGDKVDEAWLTQDAASHRVGLTTRSVTSYRKSDGTLQIVHDENVEWDVKILTPQGYGFVTRESIWDASDAQDYRVAVETTSSIAKKYELNGSLISTTTTTNTFTPYGDLAMQTIETTGAGQSFTKMIDNEYFNDESEWQLGRLTESTVSRSGSYGSLTTPTRSRTSQWAYYGSSDGAKNGMLKAEIVEPYKPAYRTEKTYFYNSMGLTSQVVTTAPGASARSISYEYDSVGRLEKEINSLGHSKTFTYHPESGLKATETDSNGLVMSWAYDSVGRPLRVTEPDGSVTHTTYNGCATGCPANVVYWTSTWQEAGSGAVLSPPSSEYKDMLGRTVETRSEGMGGKIIITRKEYDADARLLRESEPYFSTEFPAWNTVMSRDARGRVVEKESASGVTAVNAYNGLVVSQTETWADPIDASVKSRTTSVESDVLDNMRTATDAAGRTIEYEYDAFDALVRVVLPGQREVVNAYDDVGRKISSSDDNVGLWRYHYNGFGELVLQENGNGRRVCKVYDELGRQVSRTDDFAPAATWETASQSALSGCAGQPATTQWLFDSLAQGDGRLYQVLDSSGYVEDLVYDSLGRISQKTISFDGATYTTSTTFDPATGRPDTQTLPSPTGGASVVMEYRYDNRGFLTEVGKPGQTGFYWRVTDQDARGHVTGKDLADGMARVERDYDPASGVATHFRAKSTYGSGWNLLNEVYTYSARGYMRKRAESITSINQDVDEVFDYDSLDRLIAASITNANDPTLSYTQSATYTATGNLDTKSDVGAYTYGGTCTYQGVTYEAGPDAVTSVAGTRTASYCYDDAGNMLSGDGKEITYDVANKPTQITSADANMSFEYGPNREMLKRITSTTGKNVEKVTIGAYEKVVVTENGVTTTKERYQISGGIVVSFEQADYTSPIEELLFYDVLGSVVATTDGLGVVKERFKYDPWGRPREYMEWLTMSDTTWHSMDRHLQATNKGFTGHEMLDEVGIIHMGGRIYEPTIGRFLSADPVVKGLHNPESYNRYSYVLNSPLSFTDPSGYSWWSENVTDQWREVKTDVFRAALAILTVFTPSNLAFYEAGFRYGGRELARFAAKHDFAGAVIGLVGIAGCSAASAGSATASCVASYQGITTAAITHANGGSIGKALVAGIESAALAYTNAKIAGAIGDVGAGPIASGVMHGMRGAGFAVIGGGDLRSGLIGGFTEGALGGYIQKWMPNNRTGGTVTAAFVSGSVSEVTGGKFATGAVTGAMGYLFNTAAHGDEGGTEHGNSQPGEQHGVYSSVSESRFKMCVSTCLQERYGAIYEWAQNLSPVSVPSMVASEFSAAVQDSALKHSNRNMWSGDVSRYATGLRQSGLGKVLTRINAGAAVAGSGALGVTVGAQIYCRMTCP